jgi:hypothetical protein
VEGSRELQASDRAAGVAHPKFCGSLDSALTLPRAVRGHSPARSRSMPAATASLRSLRNVLAEFDILFHESLKTSALAVFLDYDGTLTPI